MKLLNKEQQAALKQALTNKKLSPLRQEALKNEIFKNLDKEVSNANKMNFFFYKPLAISLTVIIVIVLTGGVVIATEKSLPGDILHPIKLTAEKIQLKIAISEEKKATIEAKQAEERLNEATKIKEKKSVEPLIEKEAKVKAEKVIENLEAVKAKLETKANNKAAENINRAIEKIEKQAEKAKIRLEKKEKQREENKEIKKEEKKD